MWEGHHDDDDDDDDDVGLEGGGLAGPCDADDAPCAPAGIFTRTS